MTTTSSESDYHETILMIQDDPMLRESIPGILEWERFHTLEAAVGKTWYELALRSQPDLIICDVELPDQDGYERVRRLRKNESTSHIPSFS